MPFQYDLVVVDSVENLGLPIASIKGALQSTIGSGRRNSKHRTKEDPCEAAIAEAVEVRAGFDYVGGI